MTPATITPFWHRMRAITTYPLRGGAVFALFGLTLARLITILPLGLLGLLLHVILWAGVYTYAVGILRNTANGHMDAPEFNVDGDSGGRAQLVLQFMFVLMLFGGFAMFGPVGGTIVAIGLGLAMPGATIALALDGSLWNALNPVTWLAIATRLGWPYLAMTALCAVIVVSEANAQAMLRFLPPVLDVFAGYLVATYAVFATFHLMGYVIYQYHEVLGYEISRPLRLRDPNADPDQDVLDEVEAMVLAGDTDGAEKHLEHRLRVRGGTPAVHARYRRLLQVRGDNAGLLRHGREQLAVLMAQDQHKAALELVRQCLALDPAFAPTQPELVAPLARRAATTAQAKLAVQLLSGFEARHPGHADVAANGLLAAKLLAETLGDDAAARTLLANVRRAVGTHDPLRGEIDAYQQFLDKLAAPVARA
jgi:hypothetical protein